MSPTSPFESLHADGHQLSVFFAVLALGTFVDISNPPNPTTAAQYYHLSRAALSLDSVLEKPSLLAIQALVSPFAMDLFMALNDEPMGK